MSITTSKIRTPAYEKLSVADGFSAKMGHFGRFGGKFVPETIMPSLDQLEQAYNDAKNDPTFNTELEYYLREYVGRPSTLYYAERLTKKTWRR